MVAAQSSGFVREIVAVAAAVPAQDDVRTILGHMGRVLRVWEASSLFWAMKSVFVSCF